MALNSATYSTRSVSMLMLAAFGGLALWLFVPWAGNAGSGGGGGASAELPPSLKVAGQVQVESHDNVITRLVVPLSVRGNEGIALVDDNGGMRAETAMSDTASAAVPARYSVTWTAGNGDKILDPGEQALLTVDLPARTSVHPGNPLRLVIHPVAGGSVVIEDVLGGS